MFIILLNKLKNHRRWWDCGDYFTDITALTLIRFINIRSNTCNQPRYSWSVWVSVLILANSSLTLFINILLPFSILIKKKKLHQDKKKKKKGGKHGRSSSTLLKMHISVSCYISRINLFHAISLKQSPWWKPSGSFCQLFFSPPRRCASLRAMHMKR